MQLLGLPSPFSPGRFHVRSVVEDVALDRSVVEDVALERAFLSFHSCSVLNSSLDQAARYHILGF
jgi:hypothetical protein